MVFTFRPAATGGWLAFASGPRLLLVDAPTTEFVGSAWEAIVTPDGFQASLDLLTSRGLAATPSFVLVEWPSAGTARIIVRGDAELAVTDARGVETITAAGVSTWVERTVPAVTAYAITVPGGTAAWSESLPFESGVSYVDWIASVAGAASPPSVALPSPGAIVDAAAGSLPPMAATKPERRIAPRVPAAAVEVDVEATVREVPNEDEVLTTSITEAPAEPESGDYDYLFGDTMYRGVTDAAVHEPEEAEAGAEPVDDALHDGETVLTADVAKLRGKRRQGRTVEPPRPETPAQLVLVLSTTGVREPLTQPILIGRSPSVNKVSGGRMPRLITVGTADQDISRNHAQFSLEGGTVVVTDLHSRNGTSIVLPGKSPQKLRAGEPTSVIVGTVVDLGSGVTLTVEEDA